MDAREWLMLVAAVLVCPAVYAVALLLRAAGLIR
jgi:hypothetical protein